MPAGPRIGAEPAAAGDQEVLPIALGQGLRPVVLGVGGDSTLAELGGDAVPPQLLLGVHAYGGRLLGYFVAETVRTGSWGGLSLGSLTLGDAVVLARRTGDALSLVGLRRGAHHGVVALRDGDSALARARARSEFLDALRPLTRLGLARMAFTEKGGNLEPSLARVAAAATAEALVLRTLAALHIDVHRATVAIHDTMPLARIVATALGRRGVRILSPAELAAAADVLLVGASLWRLWQREATAIRARAVLPLGATSVAPGACERLHERGVIVVPETLVHGGMLAVLDLRARGLGEKDAQDRGVAAALGRLDTLLDQALQPTPTA